MIVCDRCNKEMKFVEPKNRKLVTLYKTEGSSINKTTDLCNDCLCMLGNIEAKMQS
jgi:hypothetical protein